MASARPTAIRSARQGGRSSAHRGPARQPRLAGDGGLAALALQLGQTDIPQRLGHAQLLLAVRGVAAVLLDLLHGSEQVAFHPLGEVGKDSGIMVILTPSS